MTSISAYVLGTEDRRMFSIEGFTFHVHRSPGVRDVGFVGIGRDGDYVPPDALEPKVLARLLTGISGLTESWTTTYSAASDEALEQAEVALLEAGSRYWHISRRAHRDPEAAAAIVALPREGTLRRWIRFDGAFSLDLELPLADDASVVATRGMAEAHSFVEDTLRSLGVAVRRAGISETDPRYVLPRTQVRSFLDAALVRLGAESVSVGDGPTSDAP